MEAEFVQWLRSRVSSSSTVLTGIGDDAAVVKLSADRGVLTSDMLMDGVDFLLGECEPRLVGRKALAVNLSDLAAMAARPTAAIVSVAVTTDTALLKGVYEGLLELADEFAVPLAGGDTNSWDGPFAISVTLLGEPTARGPVLRSGGQVGDQLLVTGDFGGSILGSHFEFTPRLAEALLLHELADLHAAIDVSDGLSLDLSRLAQESGCGALIQLDQIPVSSAARTLATQGQDTRTPLEHALGDGEDFELIVAVSADEAEQLLATQPLSVPLTRIGELIDEPGIWQIDQSGQRRPLSPTGYLH